MNAKKLFRAGRFVEAELEFQKEALRSPSPTALYNLALCQVWRGTYQKAKTTLSEIQTSDEGMRKVIRQNLSLLQDMEKNDIPKKTSNLLSVCIPKQTEKGIERVWVQTLQTEGIPLAGIMLSVPKYNVGFLDTLWLWWGDFLEKEEEAVHSPWWGIKTALSAHYTVFAGQAHTTPLLIEQVRVRLKGGEESDRSIVMEPWTLTMRERDSTFPQEETSQKARPIEFGLAVLEGEEVRAWDLVRSLSNELTPLWVPDLPKKVGDQIGYLRHTRGIKGLHSLRSE